MNNDTRQASLLPAIALISLATAFVAGTAGAAALAGPATTTAVAPAAPAAAMDPIPAVSDAVLAAVAARIPGAQVQNLRATPIAGLFELRQGGDVVYVTADGRYGVSGDIYRLADKANLTEERRRALRIELINAVPESSMVVFSPPQPKYTVTVFTDVDCHYCRTLHQQIAEYNRLGVKVRYLFFPRSGPDTESWYKAEQVWCSADRRSALTEAKQGKQLQAKVCNPNPIAQGYELGRTIGLEGTPGIVTESGEMLPGYAPPDVLVQEIEHSLKGATRAAPKG
jgi:thiol:disulfide interchange protein DsbC